MVVRSTIKVSAPRGPDPDDVIRVVVDEWRQIEAQIRSAWPKDTGDSASGWRVSAVRRSGGSIVVTLGNRERYAKFVKMKGTGTSALEAVVEPIIHEATRRAARRMTRAVASALLADFGRAVNGV